MALFSLCLSNGSQNDFSITVGHLFALKNALEECHFYTHREFPLLSQENVRFVRIRLIVDHLILFGYTFHKYLYSFIILIIFSLRNSARKIG